MFRPLENMDRVFVSLCVQITHHVEDLICTRSSGGKGWTFSQFWSKSVSFLEKLMLARIKTLIEICNKRWIYSCTVPCNFHLVWQEVKQHHSSSYSLITVSWLLCRLVDPEAGKCVPCVWNTFWGVDLKLFNADLI